jgi:beta-glucosidase
LSYTTFEYGEIQLDELDAGGSPRVNVSIDITNTGSVAGKEIVQLYVAPAINAYIGVVRPSHELKAFGKVMLEPGETKTVKFELDSRAFAYWDTRSHGWAAPANTHTIEVGASSRDIRREALTNVGGKKPLPAVSPEMTIADAREIPGSADVLQPIAQAFAPMAPADGGENIMEVFLRDMPLRAVRALMGDHAQEGMVEQMVAELDALKGAAAE